MSRLRFCLLLAALAPACRRAPEVVVFHGETLSGVLGEIAERVQRDSPGQRVRLEPSSDAMAIRKILELGLEADVVIVGDATALDPLLAARRARRKALFATDEVVLAHQDHSRFTDEIATGNWSKIVERNGVQVACGDPASSDIGLHAALALDLAGRTELSRRCAAGHRALGEPDLVALLESRSVDYVFLHRSMAESHRLKVTALPPEVSLSQRDLAPVYSRATLLAGGGARRGAPIACAFTVLDGAHNAGGAERLVAALSSEPGRRALERAGFHPLDALVVESLSPTAELAQ